MHHTSASASAAAVDLLLLRAHLAVPPHAAAAVCRFGLRPLEALKQQQHQHQLLYPFLQHAQICCAQQHLLLLLYPSPPPAAAAALSF
jgi:hypothetical protein